MVEKSMVSKSIIQNPKQLFLIDSIGALISVVLLGVVLPEFQPIFGMPETVLSRLAAIAVIFNLYSFLCYVKVKERWRIFLSIIATLNSLYCVATFSLIFVYFDELTWIGITYFLLEIPIIGGLAFWEFKTILNAKNS